MLNFFTIVLVLFALLMGYAVYNSKKNKKMAAVRYDEILSTLDYRMAEIAESRELHIGESHFCVTDEKEGYLLGIDADKREFILCGKNTANVYPFDSLAGCQVFVTPDEDPKYYQKIGIMLEFDRQESVPVVLATKRGKRNGFIGSELLRSAQEFQLFLISETKDSNA